MKKICLMFFSLLLGVFSYAQISYQKAYGGSNEEEVGKTIVATDGSLITAGSSLSVNGNWDIFLMKTDINGVVEWTKIYSHNDGFNNNMTERAHDVIQTTDGGFAVVGYIEGGLGGTQTRNRDAYMLKVDADGNREWDRIYRHSDNNVWEQDEAYAICETPGGFAIAGTAFHVYQQWQSQRDGFVLLTNGNGAIQNSVALNNNVFGGNRYEEIRDIVLVADGVVVTGFTNPSNSDEYNQNDLILAKIQFGGGVSWANTYGNGDPNYNEAGLALAVADDGGFIVTGTARMQIVNNNTNNILIAKFDQNGGFEYANLYGGAQNNAVGHDIINTASGYVIAGELRDDAMLLKVAEDGLVLSPIWSNRVGGRSDDFAVSVAENGSSFIFSGIARSFDAGAADIYFIHTNGDGETFCNEKDLENVTIVSATSQFSFLQGLQTNGGSFQTRNDEYAAYYTPIEMDIEEYCVCYPSLEIATTAPSCENEGVDFRYTTIENLGTFTWDFGEDADVSQATDLNTAYPKGIRYTMEGIKYVTLNISDGVCIENNVQEVIIHAVPTVAITSQSANTICQEETANFTSSVVESSAQWQFLWDFGNSISSTEQNPSQVVFPFEGTQNIKLTVSDENCANFATSSITVNPNPVADFGLADPLCTGETVSFANLGSAGASYSWNFGAGATPITSTLENPTTVYSYGSQGEKIITLTTTLGSCSKTVSKSATIHLTPNVNFVYLTGICAGEGVMFINTGETGTDWNYEWDFGTGATPHQSTQMNPQSVKYGTGGNRTASLKIFSDYCSNSASQTVTIDSLPIIDAIADTTICANRGLNLGGMDKGYNYSWFPSYTLNDPFSADPYALPEHAENTYVVTAVNPINNCVNTDTIHVRVLRPAIAEAGIDVEICRGEQIQIGAGFIEGQSYSWSPSYKLADVADRNESSPIAKPDSTTTFWVEVAYEGCDEITDSVVVTVHQLPNVQATDWEHKDTSEIARGETVQLIGTGAVQYEWTPYQSLDNEGIFNPLASPEETTLYTLMGTDVFGCVNYDSVLVIVNTPDTWVPSAFTPDGDGLNDIFRVRCKGTTEFQLAIYTRSGEQVYFSENLQEGWNGYKQGTNKELPAGAYVYYFKGTYSDGELFNQKGMVNLIR